jgi:N-acetylglucosamine-6-sulfatase
LALKPGGSSKARLAIAAAVAALLLSALGFALLVRGTGTAAAQAPGTGERPNVVVIETDDQTQESIAVMPNARQLIGGQGVTFPNSFVNWAVCCPSRATLLTGQYAHNHGVLGNASPLGGFDRLDSSNTLPVWLQGAGYYTGLIGKYLNGYEGHRDDPGGPLIPPGYSEWRGSTRTYDFYGYELNEGGTLTTYGALTDNPDSPSDPSQYSTDVYTGKAVDFINRRAPSEQPFFLWLSYLAPHSGGPNPSGNHCAGTAKPPVRDLHAFDSVPLPQGPAFNEADVSDKPSFIRRLPRLSATRREAIEESYRQRLESLLAVDEGVMRIVEALRAAGELENTLIIFTSDNGFFHGEHRVPHGKVMLYEPSVEVPLIMRGPGVPRAARRRQLVTNADLAPTILEAAGATPRRVQDGRSLSALLRDRGLEWGRELLFEGPTGFDAVAFSALRNERYLYAEHDNGERELYDLARDPHQLESMADDPAHAALQARLAERLAALQVCAGASCRTSPRVRLALRRCRPSVRAAARALERVRVRRRGTMLRARVRTVDGRVVTLDRRLPRFCRP